MPAPARDAGIGRRRARGNHAFACSRKVSPWCPAGTHPSLPKKLTSSSWRPSPESPECPHRHLPQALTKASRKGSPASPAGTHQLLPGRLTECSRIDSPSPSRKSSLAAPEKPHLCDDSGFALLKYDCECASAHRVKRPHGADFAAGSTHFEVRRECRYRRDEQARHVRWCGVPCVQGTGSSALYS